MHKLVYMWVSWVESGGVSECLCVCVCVCVCVRTHLHQLREIVSQLIITAALDPAHGHFPHLCVSEPEYNTKNVLHAQLPLHKASHETNKVVKNDLKFESKTKKNHKTEVKH